MWFSRYSCGITFSGRSWCSKSSVSVSGTMCLSWLTRLKGRGDKIQPFRSDVVFALFVRNHFLGAILVLEEFRVRKRDDVFELVNAVEGAWGQDPALQI